MDADISLTPPRSPVGDSDEIQFNSSPVLVGKIFKRTARQNVGRTRGEPSYTGYRDTDFVKCHLPINGKSCYKEHFINSSLIANAWKYWSVSNAGEEPRGLRKVMGQDMHMNDLKEPDCDVLFQVVMYFHDIADVVKKKTGSSSYTAAEMDLVKKCRRYIEESMLFVCEFVESCDQDLKNSDVLINIFDLMVMISNMSYSSILDGSKYVVQAYVGNSEAGKKMHGPVAEWYHSYIHIQSTMLKLLPSLLTRESVMHHINSTQVFFDNCVEISESGFYHKIVKKIFSMSLNIALELYIYGQRNSRTDRGTFFHSLFFESSPFPCLCMQELMSLCLYTAVEMELRKQTVQEDYDTFASQTRDLSKQERLDNCAPMFWKMISVFVSTVIQDVPKKKSHDKLSTGPTLQCLDTTQDALSFCWWWTWEVARLFLLSEDGTYKIRVTCSSHMPLLSKLLRLTFSTCDGDMELMSLHLSCYRTIVYFWRNNSEHPETPFSVELAHFHLLWAHFSKKLNFVKNSESYGMQKYTITDDKSISPEKWIRKCDMYLKKIENHWDKSRFVVSDPFHSFLLLFGEILSFGCWKDLKVKFISRLQIGDMRTLTDHGLSNLFQLFLLVASSNIDNAERLLVLSKLTTYLEHVSFNKTDYRKIKVMLNGLFSCMQLGLSLPRPINVQAIAKKCGATIAAVFKLFSDGSRNLEQRNMLWKIIEFYFKNLTQLFQMSSSFHLCQDMILPSENARQFLSVFKCSEAVSILGNLTTMFSTLRTHLQHTKSKESFNSGASTVSALLNFFLPWLKTLAKTEDKAVEEVVNTLMEMFGVILVIDQFKLAILPVKLSNLLSHFCCSVDIRMPIRCHLVLRILSNECQELSDAINGSNVESGAYRTAVIQGALKSIVCHPNKEYRDDIAKSLSNICVIRDIVKQAKSCTGTENSFENFLMALRDKFMQSVSGVWTMKGCELVIRDNYLGYQPEMLTLLQAEDRTKLRDQVSVWFNPISKIISALSNLHDAKSVVIYKMCGTIVKHCGSILYLAGNRGLVTQIFDVLVLPRSVYVPRDKNINTSLRTALSQTLDIFVIGLLNLDFARDTYVQRVLRDIVNIYLTRFPVRFQAGTIVTPHPFTRICLSCDLEPLQRGAFLKVLSNQCRAGPEADRSSSTVVNIVHLWLHQSKEILTGDEVASLRTIVSKAKFIDDPVSKRKSEFIYHKVKEL